MRCSLAAVRFRITHHSGHLVPDDALDVLWQRLGAGEHELTFIRVGAEIEVSVEGDAPVSMTHDEREEVGRRTVLGLVLDACEHAPELESDWFAVSGEV